ncbi:MAG: hypothetical protein QGI78_00750 [Phycisphaerales bacterium]|jgi:hypothetical protein|nr:hypothetical protein [Phycisphaerales bacterium]
MLSKPIKSFVFSLFIALSVFADSQPCDILNRVVVTGASVSSGFGVTTPPIKGDFGAYPINMKHIMEGVISSEHEEVKFFGDLLFFKRSKANAKAYIKKIKEYKPTLIVGVDFLFWFGHGTPPDGTDVSTYRMEKLNFALDLLGELKVPIIIGDLPNVRSAIGKMLSANQVPSKELLLLLNKRIHEWGEAHPNVTVVDVFDLSNKLMNDEAITFLGHTWPAGSQSKLLQQDMLHTTFEGTVAASMMVAEEINVGCIETDPKLIMKNASATARKEANRKE